MPSTDTASRSAALPRWHDSVDNQADTWPSMPGPLVPGEPTPAPRRATARSRDNGAAFIAHQKRLTSRAEAAAEFVVALVVAIAIALLLIHWLTPCDAGHLCTFAAIASRRVRAGESVPPDDRPSALPVVSEAVRRAYGSGFDDGERSGYVDGWRWGAVCGFVLGILTGGCLVAGALLMGMQA